MGRGTPGDGSDAVATLAGRVGSEAPARTATGQDQGRPVPGLVRTRGGAALYYAAFSLRETGIEEVWVVGSLVICASLLVHGVSAPLTKLYGKLPKNVCDSQHPDHERHLELTAGQPMTGSRTST